MLAMRTFSITFGFLVVAFAAEVRSQEPVEVLQPDLPSAPNVVVPVPKAGGDEVLVPMPDDGSKIYDPFTVPDGLSMSVDSLLQILGQNHDCQLCGVPFPFTVGSCESLGGEAFRKGLYQDAIAIANHGMTQKKTPTLLYIRGVSELAIGESHACVMTMRELIPIHPPTTPTQELSSRVGGPIAVRFLIGFRAVRGNDEIVIEKFANSGTRRSRQSLGGQQIATYQK